MFNPMFERREALLTKRSSNGLLAFGRVTSCHAMMAGVLVGMALGMFLSMALLSWYPGGSQGLRDGPRTVAEMLPSIKEDHPARRFEKETGRHEDKTDGQAEVTVDTSVHANSQEDIEKQVASLAGVEPSLKLHEGRRELTDFEKNGGWRFTPAILTVSEQQPNVQIMSASEPRVLLFKKFLSRSEVEHILQTATPHLSRSKVVGEKEGQENKVRTSYGAWLTDRIRDEVVQEIEARIHDYVGIPAAFGEGIYVLRYELEQKYNPHTDNCARAGEHVSDSCLGFLKRSGGPTCGEGRGGASCGDRIATFIMYLKSPTLGGETIFPRSRISKTNLNKAGRKSSPGDFGEACKSRLLFKVQPQPGDAVLFFDYLPRTDIENHQTFVRNGSWENKTAETEAFNDNTSLHGGCPVLEGEKWIATKWIRSTVFR